MNGPEILDKFVGGSEQKIRDLFADAEAEQKAEGANSMLHIIIFDEVRRSDTFVSARAPQLLSSGALHVVGAEAPLNWQIPFVSMCLQFDAICKSRGSTSDSTGVSDSIVNQLLSKIDGVDSINNVLIIGMTNRKDMIDDAVLRPGRLEVLPRVTWALSTDSERCPHQRTALLSCANGLSSASHLSSCCGDPLRRCWRCPDQVHVEIGLTLTLTPIRCTWRLASLRWTGARTFSRSTPPICAR